MSWIIFLTVIGYILVRGNYLMRIIVVGFFVVCFFIGRNAAQKIDDAESASAEGSDQKKTAAGMHGDSQSASSHAKTKMPTMQELIYPAELPSFEMLAANGHEDLRALVYTIKDLYINAKRPFSDGELSFADFGKKKEAYRLLQKNGLIQQLDAAEEIEKVFTKNELLKLSQERKLSLKGKKHTLAERLVKDGFKIDRRKYRNHLFWLTEKGKNAIQSYKDERQCAITNAIISLKKLNYREAIVAYRKFDRKWGFAHTSGKKHTIFACADIPYRYFSYLEGFPMCELQNTPNFRNTLRACLLAGLMRGCQDRTELRANFEIICDERMNCYDLLSLFDYPEEVLEVMQEQIDINPRVALEYYISHVLYLTRKES